MTDGPRREPTRTLVEDLEAAVARIDAPRDSELRARLRAAGVRLREEAGRLRHDRDNAGNANAFTLDIYALATLERINGGPVKP